MSFIIWVRCLSLLAIYYSGKCPEKPIFFEFLYEVPVSSNQAHCRNPRWHGKMNGAEKIIRRTTWHSSFCGVTTPSVLHQTRVTLT